MRSRNRPIAEVNAYPGRESLTTAKALAEKFILGRAAASSRPAMRRLGEHHGQVVGMDVVEQRAGALVEHVGIDPARLEQGDTALPLGALDLELCELGGQLRHLLVDV